MQHFYDVEFQAGSTLQAGRWSDGLSIIGKMLGLLVTIALMKRGWWSVCISRVAVVFLPVTIDGHLGDEVRARISC